MKLPVLLQIQPEKDRYPTLGTRARLSSDLDICLLGFLIPSPRQDTTPSIHLSSLLSSSSSRSSCSSCEERFGSEGPRSMQRLAPGAPWKSSASAHMFSFYKTRNEGAVFTPMGSFSPMLPSRPDKYLFIFSPSSSSFLICGIRDRI